MTVFDGWELWERFCIMTADGNVPDILALAVLKKCTTPRLYKWLEEAARKTSGWKDSRALF